MYVGNINLIININFCIKKIAFRSSMLLQDCVSCSVTQSPTGEACWSYPSAQKIMTNRWVYGCRYGLLDSDPLCQCYYFFNSCSFHQKYEKYTCLESAFYGRDRKLPWSWESAFSFHWLNALCWCDVNTFMLCRNRSKSFCQLHGMLSRFYF